MTDLFPNFKQPPKEEDKVKTPKEKYMNDPEYNHLVNILERLIAQGRFTPSELREACILASINYEMRHIRGKQIGPRLDGAIRVLDRFVSKKPNIMGGGLLMSATKTQQEFKPSKITIDMEGAMGDKKRCYVIFEKHIGFGIRWDSVDYELDVAVSFPFITIVFGFGEEI